MKLNDKIELANRLCSGVKGNKYDYLYPFTTENISGYIEMFDFNNKSFLTVGSSADQAFNAILNGCMDITVVDICPFVREYAFLKAAAVSCMSREQFLNFFGSKKNLISKNHYTFTNSNFFTLLNKLSDINIDASNFWTSLFRSYRSSQIRKKLFIDDEFNIKALVKMNPYLNNDDNYYRLRSQIHNIRNVRFITEDIFEYDSDRKFDNINLSNLGLLYKIGVFEKLIYNMVDMLNDNGKMLVAYLFDVDTCNEINIKRLLEILPNNADMESFIGSNGIEVNCNVFKDSVITYKKVKKITK